MLRLTFELKPKINSTPPTHTHTSPPTPNPHIATPPPLLQPATPPNPPQTLLSSHCFRFCLWSICLSVWGYKGSRRRGLLESGGAPGGGWVGGEVPLWGTRTIIKDSTAASAWFACLIICHMLHSTTISHIRALSRQQTSLRLEMGLWGSGRHAGKLHTDGAKAAPQTAPTLISPQILMRFQLIHISTHHNHENENILGLSDDSLPFFQNTV